MLWLIRVLNGRLGPYILYGFLILIACGFIYTAVSVHDHNVALQATAEWNKKQLETIIDNQKRFQDDMKAVADLSKELSDKTAQTNDALDKLDQNLKDSVKKMEDARDKASETVKEAIRQLKKNP